MKHRVDLKTLWKEIDFEPNENQEKAIFWTEGPLYLPAGPGSGKTRVILWRTINLIVNHDVDPKEIFLSTFTEKAAKQLHEGLQNYLSMITRRAGTHFDISQMYIGTVHSLCFRLLAERRVSPERMRRHMPRVLDELEQYMIFTKRKNWNQLLEAAKLTVSEINEFFGGRTKASISRHKAAPQILALFNRFSEECLDPKQASKKTVTEVVKKFILMYQGYLGLLQTESAKRVTDLSLLQQEALKLLESNPASKSIFRHTIIDEYQDTNSVQERIFFLLAGVHKNICVVGDDDQALYRFRGATVENFVEFQERCEKRLGVKPKCLPLDINYRSRSGIVEFCQKYLKTVNWQDENKPGKYYRVMEKEIRVGRTKEVGISVLTTAPGDPENCASEIAIFVKELIAKKKVEHPNQIAFLFPSVKNVPAKKMKAALEAEGLEVYAPRAGHFLEIIEVQDMLGVMGQIIGFPEQETEYQGDWKSYLEWVSRIDDRAKTIVKQDPALRTYISDRKKEAKRALEDGKKIKDQIAAQGWKEKDIYLPDKMRDIILKTPGLSAGAKATIQNKTFERVVNQRLKNKNESGAKEPFRLTYITRAATSLDWTLMDLFWQICGFQHFKRMFDAAEKQKKERQAINLSLLSRYLDTFVGQSHPVLTAGDFIEDMLQRRLFASYLYILYVRGESEYEDQETPFPKECIPFLTIHQSKGLEFPVVVIGDPKRKGKEARLADQLIEELCQKSGEPLHRSGEFDVARQFYVGLSRAQNLLIVPYFSSSHHKVNESFQVLLETLKLTEVGKFKISDLSPTVEVKPDLAQSYSYTSDYLFYKQCPRQYMIFRYFDFSPARTQSMFFGSLIHQTIEDLHHRIIYEREKDKKAS